jgi:hypothetical protein
LFHEFLPFFPLIAAKALCSCPVDASLFILSFFVSKIIFANPASGFHVQYFPSNYFKASKLFTKAVQLTHSDFFFFFFVLNPALPIQPKAAPSFVILPVE